MKIVFVVDVEGNPLMPTSKVGKVRRWLKSGEAKIIAYEPFFTIQFTKEVKTFSQNLTLGIDTGYSFIGYSVVEPISGKEIIGGQLELDSDIKNRMESRKMYRTQRRSRLRYRAPRFNNRTKREDWLPPSTQQKIDKHNQLINMLVKIMPITQINIEMGSFDMAKMNNPEISGEEYQKGAQYGFFNIREAVLFRDGHKCQNPDCKNTDKEKILQVHHIMYKNTYGGTDNPSNLITLCSKCHTSANHKPGKLLFKWMQEKKKVRSLKDATFMNIVKTFVYKGIKKETPNIPINVTVGYITKSKRIENKIDKTHHADAFVIAGGTKQEFITEDIKLKSERRNRRSLETFRDAKYLDSRDNTIKTGMELNCGRRTRNKNLAEENLHKYRVAIIDSKTGKRKQITKGMRSISKGVSKFPKGAKIIITEDWSNGKTSVKKGYKFTSAGAFNENAYVYLPIKDDKKNNKYVPAKICKVIAKRKGIVIDNG